MTQAKKPFKHNIRGFIDEASDYYKKEYLNCPHVRRTGYLKKIDQFLALKFYYDGWEYEDLAKRFNMKPNSIRGVIYNLEKKVELYIKLKDLGRL